MHLSGARNHGSGKGFPSLSRDLGTSCCFTISLFHVIDLDRLAAHFEDMAQIIRLLGEEEYGKGNYIVAIEHYRNAWGHAQQAINK